MSPIVVTDAEGWQDHPDVIHLARGGYVAVWRSGNPPTPDASHSVVAQLFDESGTKVGGEFQVNSAWAPYDGGVPHAAALADGSFVVTWNSPTNFDGRMGFGTYVNLLAQHFSAGGTPLGSQFQMNDSPSPSGGIGEITALTDGGFLGTWTWFGGAGAQIYMQRYDAVGARVGSNVPVTATGAFAPDVTALNDGGFAITWRDHNFIDLYSQRFDSSGAPAGQPVQLNTSTQYIFDPEIAALSNGRIAVAWLTGTLNNDPPEFVAVRLLDNAGSPVGDEMRFSVNSYASPNVTAMADGGFVLSWISDESHDRVIQGRILAQRFDGEGRQLGERMELTTITTSQSYPQATLSPDGGVVFVWGEPDETLYMDIFGAHLADWKTPYTEHAAITAKVLGAVFGADAVANTGYEAAGIGLLDDGMTYQGLVQLALDTQLGGAATNDAVVNLLYTNVVGHAPADAVLQYYAGLIASGQYTQASLGVLAAESAENAANIDLVGLAAAGYPYA